MWRCQRHGAVCGCAWHEVWKARCCNACWRTGTPQRNSAMWCWWKRRDLTDELPWCSARVVSVFQARAWPWGRFSTQKLVNKILPSTVVADILLTAFRSPLGAMKRAAKRGRTWGPANGNAAVLATLALRWPNLMCDKTCYGPRIAGECVPCVAEFLQSLRAFGCQEASCD